MHFLPGKRSVIGLLVVAALLLLPLAGQALALTGTLTSPIGVTATDGWDNGGFSISYNIVPEGEQGGFVVWDYTYTISLGAKSLSHFILQVSDGALATDFFDVSTAFEGPLTYTNAPPSNSNPGLLGSIYGLKFAPLADNNTYPLLYTINFDTLRSPVDGIFYAKDGTDDHGTVDVYAQNTAGFYILVPDSDFTRVPLPPSALLLGSGLVGLVGLGWRRRKTNV